MLRELLRPGDVVLVKGRRGQKLDRVRLLLEGRTVGCDLALCDLQDPCVGCPMCTTGWSGHRAVLPSDLH